MVDYVRFELFNYDHNNDSPQRIKSRYWPDRKRTYLHSWWIDPSCYVPTVSRPRFCLSPIDVRSRFTFPLKDGSFHHRPFFYADDTPSGHIPCSRRPGSEQRQIKPQRENQSISAYKPYYHSQQLEGWLWWDYWFFRRRKMWRWRLISTRKDGTAWSIYPRSIIFIASRFRGMWSPPLVGKSDWSEERYQRTIYILRVSKGINIQRNFIHKMEWILI
jgi:hypothetical protein